MKTALINEICNLMNEYLTEEQTNMKLLNLFIAAKKIEGCSENTLKYYSSTLLNMINSIEKCT